MSYFTPSDRHWHRVYAAGPAHFQSLVDESFKSICDTITGHFSELEMKLAFDDRAEVLIAALARFVVESNPNHPAVIAALEAAKEE